MARCPSGRASARPLASALSSPPPLRERPVSSYPATAFVLGQRMTRQCRTSQTLQTSATFPSCIWCSQADLFSDFLSIRRHGSGGGAYEPGHIPQRFCRFRATASVLRSPGVQSWMSRIVSPLDPSAQIQTQDSVEAHQRLHGQGRACVGRLGRKVLIRPRALGRSMPDCQHTEALVHLESLAHSPVQKLGQLNTYPKRTP